MEAPHHERAGSPLAVTGLTVAYGPHRALDDVGFALTGSITALIGHNGAGKSTLMKTVLGLQEPTAGRVEAAAALGYVPEGDCLPLGESAFGFVSRMARLSGLPRTAAMERAGDVLRLVGLGEAAQRPIGAYSLGMKQRAKLAQALVHDPELVLMDEPTNGLDPQGREEILSLIAGVARDCQIAFLVSSHLLGELQAISDHALVLQEGRLISDAPLHALTRSTGHLQVGLVADDLDEALPRVAAALAVEGVAAQIEGRVLIVPDEPAARTALGRVCVAQRCGVMRMTPRRAELVEVFTGEGVGVA